MRKVLSFVLVLSLVLGSFGMAFAAPLSDIAGEECEDAVNVLTDLEVVTGYPDGDYRPDNIVTRAEMAVIVVRALGLADYAVGTSSFKDMAGHWSNAYVAYATGLGIIDGYPDGTFKPDKTVSYDEAAKMLVAALGYTPDSLVGTWPANYVVKAKALGILDGIKAGVAGANRGDIAIMAFQTLDTKIGSTDKDGKWTANDPEDTMLDRLGAELYNDGDAFVVTNDIALDESVINLTPYLGAFIKAYQNSDKDIIAVKEVKSAFLTGSVKDNGKFKSDGVEYNIAGADFHDGTTEGAIEFVNGENTSTVAAITTSSGIVTLAANVSGKTIKDVYSVSKWTVSESDFFSADDAADIKADKKLFGLKFVKDDNDDIDLNSFALFGAASLADIEKDSVVYVYKNGASEITRIEVGTEVVTGENTRISGDDFTINGKVYAFADSQSSSSSHYVPAKAGDTVKISLDYAGDIYECVKEKGGASNYAVVLDVKDGSEGFAGSDAKINLFLADGTEKAFSVDEEEVASVNDTSKKWTTEAAFDIGVIIKCGVDKNGVIDEIVTMSAITGDDKISAKGLYETLYIANDAVIFTATTIPAISKKADDYGTTSLNKILDTKNVVSQYIVKDGKIVAMILYDDVVSTDGVYGVAIDRALNNSSEGYEITMLLGKNETTKDAKTAAHSEAATTSALYKVNFTTSGDVISGLDAQVSDITATTVAGLTVSSNTVKIASMSGITTGSSIIKNDTISLDSDVVVYVWSTNDTCYKIGSVRDIANAKNSVEFFDVLGDDDGAYDFVLVDNPDA